MAESTKLRLVRCPKCQNLLPELEDYSVYQCGGCGAVLRAKPKNQEADSSSEGGEGEDLKAASTKSQNSAEKGAAASSNTSDSDVKSNAGSSRRQEKLPEENKCGSAENFPNLSGDNIGKCIDEDGLNKTMNRDEKDKDSNPQPRSQKSAQITDQRRVETTEAHGFGNRTSRTGFEGTRLSTSDHEDACLRNFNSESSDYHKHLRNPNARNEPNIGLNLADNRAELLRKLDELKEQLSRSCNEADKSKEKLPLDGSRILSSDPCRAVDPRASIASGGPDKAFLHHGRNNHGRPYFRHYAESFPCNNVPMPGIHPPPHTSVHISGFGDPVELQMHRRTSQQLPGQCQRLSHPYYSSQYVDASHDLFEPYPRNTIFHQPACSCFHCYDQHYRLPPQGVPTAAFGPQRCGDVPYNPGLCCDEDVRAFGSLNCRPRTVVPPPPPSSSYSHLNPEMGGFVRNRAPKVVLSSGASRHRPIAGGAPFLTCHNCFELLQLPKKILLMSKGPHRLRCGACSTVIDFSIINKKLVLSFHAEETKQNFRAVERSSNKAVAKDSTSHSHGHLNRMNGHFSSDDDDNTGYEFCSMDAEPIESTRQGLNSSKPHEMQSFESSSPSASDDGNSSDSVKAPLAGSPFQEHVEYSSNHAIDRFGMGNRSARSEKEKVMPNNKGSARQNSMKEAGVATEMEVPFNEYSHADVSQDSGDISREEDRPRTKRTESFLANIIKKSFKDLTKSGQNDDQGRSNVTVNGHPISQRLVKKAEKLAGPIQPGNYWYDHRAGFWGVMDGPCLGIIPPFIEELNYPMPENCAHGTTGVFVNGRELHDRDLDLLASRGLPTERDRSYIIDISGRVVDEDTGEELDALGRLAPTVERLKRGFGMKVPRAAA